MTTVGLSLWAPGKLEKRNQPMDLCWLASTAVTSVKRKCAHVRGPNPSPAKLLIVITMLRVACSMNMRWCHYWACYWTLLEMQQFSAALVCTYWPDSKASQRTVAGIATACCGFKLQQRQGGKQDAREAMCTCSSGAKQFADVWHSTL